MVEFPDLVARCRVSWPCDISKTPAGPVNDDAAAPDRTEGKVLAIDPQHGSFLLGTDAGMIALWAGPQDLADLQVGQTVEVELVNDESPNYPKTRYLAEQMGAVSGIPMPPPSQDAFLTAVGPLEHRAAARWRFGSKPGRVAHPRHLPAPLGLAGRGLPPALKRLRRAFHEQIPSVPASCPRWARS